MRQRTSSGSGFVDILEYQPIVLAIIDAVLRFSKHLRQGDPSDRRLYCPKMDGFQERPKRSAHVFDVVMKPLLRWLDCFICRLNPAGNGTNSLKYYAMYSSIIRVLLAFSIGRGDGAVLPP